MLPMTQTGDGPWIVLLHAGIADRSMWDEHMEPLAAAGFRVIALDLPGFGDAPLTDGPQTPWVDVLETLDGLEIDSAILVGNSFGAATALRAAITAPGRFTHLVLVSPPPLDGDPSPELAVAWDAEELALERDDLDGAIAAVLEAWLLPDAPPALRARIATMQRRAFELQTDAPPEDDTPDPAERPGALAGLTIPTLVAVGAHDFVDFRASGTDIAAAIPNCRLETMHAAGHVAPLETPEAFRDLVLEFVGPPGANS